jgi:protein-tyrosine phosphatase
MDANNLHNMRQVAPSHELAKKARLMMDYAPAHPLREVPDPYFGGDEGFVEVYEMLTVACRNLIDNVRR